MSSKKNTNLIQPLPVYLINSADSPFSEVFSVLQEPPRRRIYTDEGQTQALELTPAQSTDEYRVFIQWLISLHWVIKFKWNSKYRVPYPPKIQNVFKPFGWLAYQYLELCIQCHSHLDLLGEKIECENAAAWFCAIVRESQRNTVFRKENQSKTDSLKERRKMVYDISCGYNVIDKKNAPYEFALVEVALKLESSDIFEAEYWKPFIGAYQAWNTAVDGADWGATHQKIDKLYVQNGKGKGRILLDSQKLFLKPLLHKDFRL